MYRKATDHQRWQIVRQLQMKNNILPGSYSISDIKVRVVKPLEVSFWVLLQQGRSLPMCQWQVRNWCMVSVRLLLPRTSSFSKGLQRVQSDVTSGYCCPGYNMMLFNWRWEKFGEGTVTPWAWSSRAYTGKRLLKVNGFVIRQRKA